MDNLNKKETGPIKEQTFAELLDNYDLGGGDDLEIGDSLSCPIISIGDDTVIVDTGTKLDGIVEKKELLDPEGQFLYKTGDLLELYVISKRESEVILSRALTGIQSYHYIEDAFERGIPIEGRVKLTCKGGFEVEIMKRRAFCPISQIDTSYVEDPEKYVGSVYQFLIMTYESKGKNIIVSRRKLLEREREQARQKLIEQLKPGLRLSGRVTRLMPFGVFVELVPGTEGLVPVSEISWSRVTKIEDVVSIDTEVEVEVLKVERGKKPDQLKISLSMKRLFPTPWEQAALTIKPGAILDGQVTRSRDFGVFVELIPGVEGLVHVSEIGAEQRNVLPTNMFQPGQQVRVMVKEVNFENRRISLSIRDAEGDLWAAVMDKYQVGTQVQGVVRTKDNYSAHLSLEHGLIGVLPKNLLTKSSFKKLSEGQRLAVIVTDIDPQARSLTLAPAQKSEELDLESFNTGENQPQTELGRKLLQALDAKQKKDKDDAGR
ncbi:S1 RNA-binding domain-containing protein [bacterium]|nr:S1 RNA-binding domain-containing protein [bacterium]